MDSCKHKKFWPPEVCNYQPQFPPFGIQISLNSNSVRTVFRTLVLGLMVLQISSQFLAPRTCLSIYWLFKWWGVHDWIQWHVHTHTHIHTETYITLEYGRVNSWNLNYKYFEMLYKYIVQCSLQHYLQQTGHGSNLDVYPQMNG